MGDFESFKQQALQLSNILNGPSRIPDRYLKTLWDASEGGDPFSRVERAINQLIPALENGDVPADNDDHGPWSSNDHHHHHHDHHKHKKDKKSKKDKYSRHSRDSPKSSSTFGVWGNDLGQAGMRGPSWGSSSRKPQTTGFGASFNTMDDNGDGVIDPSEWAAHGGSLKQFNALDIDHDGHITKKEWEAVGRAHADDHAESDTDSDNDWWRQPGPSGSPSVGFGGSGGGSFGGSWGW